MQRLFLARNSSSKPLERKPLLKCLSLLIPLLSCAAQQRHVYNPNPKVQEMHCSLEDHNGETVLAYESAGQKNSIKLDVKGFKQLELFCQKKRTIIITDDAIIRSLGYEDIAAGREMVGTLPDPDDRFRPENVVVLGIGPLNSGRIIAATAEDNLLTIITESGAVWRIDVDRPTEQAMRIGLVDSLALKNRRY